MNSTSFGKKSFLTTDGLVDAEPLYVSNLQIGGTAHNVVFVVSEHNSVYAFDADTFTQLWKVSMTPSGETTSDAVNGCGQVAPEIGITSTPVIDLKAGPNGTIYLVAMTKNGSTYFHRLRALDLTTGADLAGSPVTIQASFPSTGGTITFAPKQYKERAALLLLNGVIYTSWASHCDIDPYSGWLMGYNQSSLQQTSVLNITPNGVRNEHLVRLAADRFDCVLDRNFNRLMSFPARKSIGIAGVDDERAGRSFLEVLAADEHRSRGGLRLREHAPPRRSLRQDGKQEVRAFFVADPGFGRCEGHALDRRKLRKSCRRKR